MKYFEYLNKWKEIYDILLQFLEDENEEDYNFHSLIESIEEQKIQENHEEITLYLNLLVKVSNNHHRNHNFVKKIEQILEYFFSRIKKSFTNLELFSIFKSNKLLVLFLIKKQIIIVDEILVKQIIYRSQKTNTKYHQFFYPEIKAFITNEKIDDLEKELISENQNIFTDFEEKRERGENISYICELIRNDSIDDFVVSINRNVSLLNATINPSIFETNSFLLKNRPSLIEYAAFYGSIQIFQYLKLNDNGREFQPSLWIYAIHGQNPEIIHILEENHVNPPNNSYLSCFVESIKCHHNDIANYIKDVLMEIEEDKIYCKCIFQYYNFKLIPNKIDNLICYYL